MKSSNKVDLRLEDAENYARQFLHEIKAALCEPDMRWPCTIVGSLRRLRPVVHDIDLVWGPGWQGVPELKEFCLQRGEIIRWGPKLAAITYHDVPIDLYFSTPETFPTLLLIRTGSKENNIRLCSIAKSKGWKLHASGDGLFNERGERIAGDSERSIYDALGVPWQEPWERG